MTELYNAAMRNISPEWREMLETKELITIMEAINSTHFTPKAENIFEFAKLTPLDAIKVVIIGQDPYPKEGAAHGLAFSCLNDIPASLKNIYKCLIQHKLIKQMPQTGNLERLARGGVLLINRSLTTLIGAPNSHAALWQQYTSELVSRLSSKKPLIFMLWGNNAAELSKHIAGTSTIYKWSHPSPLAQSRQKFVDCPHFLDANNLLPRLGYSPIDWNPDADEVSREFGDALVVFTDGSCYPNTTSPQAKGGYAAAFVYGSMKDVILYGNLDTSKHHATNQRAEGMAMLKVQKYLLERRAEWHRCIIISDSDFWIKMYLNYMPNWAKTNKFDEKKNPDLTKEMWAVYSNILDCGKIIEFRHVKSHGKDNWQNEPADSYKYFCYTNNDYVDKLASYARTSIKHTRDVVSKVDYE